MSMIHRIIKTARRAGKTLAAWHERMNARLLCNRCGHRLGDNPNCKDCVDYTDQFPIF